jgi:taurine dioxygenase
VSGIIIRRLQPRIGAEIEGLDLKKPLTVEARDLVYQALLDHGVIFFRDQNITREEHIAFGRAFGEFHPPITAIEGYPDILDVKSDGANPSGADMWHSDHSDHLIPPMGSILRAVKLPPLGGDTLWSSAVSAYRALSPELKKKIEGRMCVHDFRMNIARPKYGAKKTTQILAQSEPRVNPVVAVHPDTGEPLLFVNRNFTTHILDMEKEESDTILRQLFDEIAKPDHQIRFSWRVHSIAFWDNRAVQHYAVYDYTEPRRHERVTIRGQTPTQKFGEKVVPFRLPELTH